MITGKKISLANHSIEALLQQLNNHLTVYNSSSLEIISQMIQTTVINERLQTKIQNLLQACKKFISHPRNQPSLLKQNYLDKSKKIITKLENTFMELYTFKDFKQPKLITDLLNFCKKLIQEHRENQLKGCKFEQVILSQQTAKHLLWAPAPVQYEYFILISKLGSGQTGFTSLCEYTRDDPTILNLCLKINGKNYITLKSIKEDASPNEKHMFKNEGEVAKTLLPKKGNYNHAMPIEDDNGNNYILTRYELVFFEEKNRIESYQSCDLERFVQLFYYKKTFFPIKESNELFADIDIFFMQILSHLRSSIADIHDKRIIHNDVSPRNTMMSNPKYNSFGKEVEHACLAIDYGLAKILPENQSTAIVNKEQLVPIAWSNYDVLINHVYSYLNDLFAFRVTLINILMMQLGQDQLDFLLHKTEPENLNPYIIQKISTLGESGYLKEQCEELRKLFSENDEKKTIVKKFLHYFESYLIWEGIDTKIKKERDYEKLIKEDFELFQKTLNEFIADIYTTQLKNASPKNLEEKIATYLTAQRLLAIPNVNQNEPAYLATQKLQSDMEKEFLVCEEETTLETAFRTGRQRSRGSSGKAEIFQWSTSSIIFHLMRKDPKHLQGQELPFNTKSPKETYLKTPKSASLSGLYADSSPTSPIYEEDLAKKYIGYVGF